MSQRYDTYEKYKNSNVQGLGIIPEKWDVRRIKYVCDIYNGDSINDTLKSSFESIDEASFPYIATKDINYEFSTVEYNNGLRIPHNNKRFKIAPKDSSLICIEGGSAGKKIAHLVQPVCFVNKLACFRSRNASNSKYIYYFLKSLFFQQQFHLSMTGLIGGVAISQIKQFIMPLPPESEQRRIVNFLDQKTSDFDAAIEKKQRLIDLIKEQKSILITQIVTKGLSIDTPMKDSGIPWLGEIPKHWRITPNRYLFREANDRSKSGKETHLSMSQKLGLVPAHQVERSLTSESYEGAKLVKENDLVLNRLKAHLSVFSSAPCEGLVSPDYSVFRLIDSENSVFYFENLFRTPQYLGEFNRRVKGIVIGFLRLYSGDFMAIPTIVPPLNEQISICSRIREINEKFSVVITKTENEIESLKDLRQTLIAHTVIGKIKV